MNIFLFGAPASGKSTLSTTLSKKYKLKCFQLDTIIHPLEKKGGANINIRTKVAKDIAKQDNWIAEGVYRQDWLNIILKNADYIFILKTPVHLRVYRIMKRTFRRMLGLDRVYHESSFQIMWRLIKFTISFEKDRYEEFEQRLRSIGKQGIVVRNSEDILRALLERGKS